MRGRIATALALLAAGTLVAAATSSQAARPEALHFRVADVTGTALYTFSRESPDGFELDIGRIKLKLVLRPRKKGGGALAATGGRIRMPIKQQLAEHVRLKRGSPTGDTQVTTCEQKLTTRGRARLELERVGSQVTARWASPHANPSFCPGPRLTPILTRSMAAVYSERRFERSRFTVALAGSTGLDLEGLHAGYSWRVKVKLVLE